MTKFDQGDVVLVDFVFSEMNQSKKRPALVFSGNEYNKNREEVIIAAITSNIKRMLFGDTKIEKWKETGLLFPSLVAAVLQTVKVSIIKRKLGVIQKEDFLKVQKNLAKVFSL